MDLLAWITSNCSRICVSWFSSVLIYLKYKSNSKLISSSIFLVSNDGRSTKKSVKETINSPDNRVISLSWVTLADMLNSFSIPWKFVVPSNIICPSSWLTAVDLKITFGNWSASRTLNELLSKLELPLLKSLTLATIPILEISSSSIWISPDIFLFSADHLCKKCLPD